jgi:hypothetical protein
MKVRCVKLLDSRDQPVDHSPWANLGAVYNVLSIWVEPGHTRYRILGEQSPPGLFSPDMFEIVSSVIPNTWRIGSPKPGCLSLEPEPWMRPGFWEEFYDHDAQAAACFEEEKRKIIASDP